MGTFPELLKPRFNEAALAASPSSIAVIDRPGSILWVNPAWQRFAEENGAAGASRQWRSYLDAIQPPLREYFEQAFRHTLDGGAVFEMEYECSSPTQRREFHMRALPVGGHTLIVEHALRVDVPHEPEAIAAAHEAYITTAGFVAQCSNCRRLRAPASGAFHWVPAFVQRPHPQTTHVICPSCLDFYYPRKP